MPENESKESERNEFKFEVGFREMHECIDQNRLRATRWIKRPTLSIA